MWLGHDSFAAADNTAGNSNDRLSLSRFANLQRVIGALARMAAEVHVATESESPDATETERAGS